MKKYLFLVPPALTALLMWAAFPPMDEACSIAFALVPMLIVSRFAQPKRSAKLWFLCGLLFWGGTLSWMPAIVKNNGPLPLVLLGWFGLAALCASYFALFGWMVARVWQRVRTPGGKFLALLVVEPVAWAGTEWIRSWFCTGFAWNFLGTAVGTIPAFALPARLGGVYFVSALVVLLNGVFATLASRVVRQVRREADPLDLPPKKARLVQSLETGLPLALILLSFWAARATWRPMKAVSLKVALVQRNAPCIFSRRNQAENPFDVFDRLLTAATAAKPDLVVWGESAMAEFGTSSLQGEQAETVARHYASFTGGAALLMGGDWVNALTNGERRVWNAAALYQVSPTNRQVSVQVYGKQHLVPFGEYIPLDKWITPLQKLSPIGLSLWPGESTVFDLNGVKLAPLICYEDTDPILSRAAAKKGAEALVLITNDSWFSHSVEAEQHARQAVLRAIETGLPVIRVGNSGVTGVITSSGQARWLEDGEGRVLVDAAGTMLETVNLAVKPPRTLYVKTGDAPLVVLFLLVLLLSIGTPFKGLFRRGTV